MKNNNKDLKFCQSCGMPLNDDILGTNADNSKNQDYCIYCYKDGAFTGNFTMEEMAEYCSMFVSEYNKNTGQNITCCEYKEILLKFYPTLKRWNLEPNQIPQTEHPIKKIYIKEVNALGISDLHIDNLFILQGSYINQVYQINGNNTKLLDDNEIYWCNQVKKSEEKCYGIACNEKFILVSEYGINGANAEIVILKKRN